MTVQVLFSYPDLEKESVNISLSFWFVYSRICIAVRSCFSVCVRGLLFSVLGFFFSNAVPKTIKKEATLFFLFFFLIEAVARASRLVIEVSTSVCRHERQCTNITKVYTPKRLLSRSALFFCNARCSFFLFLFFMRPR